MKKSIFLFFAIVTLAGMLAISGCKKKETYTVIFNPNGGTGTMEAQTFTEGEAQALTRNTFTYDGYTFTGWNTEQGGSGVSYTDGQTITVTADMTLYAQWTSNGTNSTPGPTPSYTFIVTFDANGGTGEMPPQPFKWTEYQSLMANAYTRENYFFVGWNTTNDGTGITYADRQSITLTGNITLYAIWSLGVTGTTSGHNYVDLGLPSGTKWAISNVGATAPEGYGDYFAWGETITKETYEWSTYRYCNGSSSTLTKYCTQADYGNNGFTDNLTTLQSSDDAATANWGSAWRMPTKEEFAELKNKCAVTRTTHNGVNGSLFTGPSGNSVFLPDIGSYWSSSLVSANPWAAQEFLSNYYTLYPCVRFAGGSVRAVCQSQN